MTCEQFLKIFQYLFENKGRKEKKKVKQMIEINSLESIHSKNQIPVLTFADLVCKLDRILRIFKMIKVNDVSTSAEVKQRVQAILNEMKKIDEQRYKMIQQKVNSFIALSLAQPPQKKVQLKSSVPSVAASKVEVKVQPSFGSQSIEKPPQKQASSAQNSKNMEPPKPSPLKQQKNEKKQKEFQKIPYNFSFDFKKQSSAEISGSMSGKFNNKTNINLKQYCQMNGSSIETKIVINEDVVNYLKTMSPDKVLLLGVQKPHDKSTDKLHISTYMEFNKEQVTSIKFKAKDYQNQLEEFVNVIRFPLALCVIGQSISDMKMHYVKFLLEMTSPLPLVFIFNQVAVDKSLLIRMSQKVINTIQNGNVIQMDSIDASINMKDKSKYKCTSFKDIVIIKDKCVTTKILYRKVNMNNQMIIENSQAIVVEKCNKLDVRMETAKTEPKTDVKLEKIQEVEKLDKNQKNQMNQKLQKVQDLKAESIQSFTGQFKYTFHAKFLSTVPYQNFVYFIKQNNEINSRKKTKTIQESIQFIKSSNSLCILGYSSKFIDKRIPPELLINILNIQDKCPMVMIRIKSLTLNKVALVSLLPGVTQEEINNTNFIYKDIEEKRVPFLNILLIGQKTQISKYENSKNLIGFYLLFPITFKKIQKVNALIKENATALIVWQSKGKLPSIKVIRGQSKFNNSFRILRQTEVYVCGGLQVRLYCMPHTFIYQSKKEMQEQFVNFNGKSLGAKMDFIEGFGFNQFFDKFISPKSDSFSSDEGRKEQNDQPGGFKSQEDFHYDFLKQVLGQVSLIHYGNNQREEVKTDSQVRVRGNHVDSLCSNKILKRQKPVNSACQHTAHKKRLKTKKTYKKTCPTCRLDDRFVE